MIDENHPDWLAKEGYYVVWHRMYPPPVRNPLIYGDQPITVPIRFEIRCFYKYHSQGSVGGYHYSSYATPSCPWELQDEWKKVEHVKAMLKSDAYSAWDPIQLCKEFLG